MADTRFDRARFVVTILAAIFFGIDMILSAWPDPDDPDDDEWEDGDE